MWKQKFTFIFSLRPGSRRERLKPSKHTICLKILSFQIKLEISAPIIIAVLSHFIRWIMFSLWINLEKKSYLPVFLCQRRIQNPVKHLREAFCENIQQLKGGKYLRKKPHLICSTRFWIRLDVTLRLLFFLLYYAFICLNVANKNK